MTCPTCEYEPVPLALRPPADAIKIFFNKIEGDVKLILEIGEDNPMTAECYKRLYWSTREFTTYLETR
jgi:hypothetical protein